MMTSLQVSRRVRVRSVAVMRFRGQFLTIGICPNGNRHFSNRWIRDSPRRHLHHFLAGQRIIAVGHPNHATPLYLILSAEPESSAFFVGYHHINYEQHMGGWDTRPRLGGPRFPGCIADRLELRRRVPPTAVVQSIAGHIYLCDSAHPPLTEVDGGTLASTGPQTLGRSPNPLGGTPVAPGGYTMTATPPTDFVLVTCGGSSAPAIGHNTATEESPFRREEVASGSST